MEQEIWKPVGKPYDLYEVSSFGQIRSVNRTIRVLNRWGKFNDRIKPGQIIKPVETRGTYYIVSLYNQKTKKRKSQRVARLVANAFLSNPEKKKQVNHLDCNKHNNKSNNLEWATHKENDDHAIKNKLHPFGENHGRAILTQEQVLQIRSLYSPRKYTITRLSNEFNVGRTTIMHILKNESWKV